MAKRKHLLLKNEFGNSLRFDRTRGVDNVDENNDNKNYSFQKEHLRLKWDEFITDRNARHASRDSRLQHLPHFDSITINFLKMVDQKFAYSLERTFGLSALSFSNFNQTIRFAISDIDRFSQNFEARLFKFCDARDNLVPEDCKALTTIQDFSYVNNATIQQGISLTALTENIIIQLADDTVSLLDCQRIIKKNLFEVLNDKKVPIHNISESLYQVDSISKEDLEYLITNFDIIQTVQGLRYLRIIPNEYGNSVLDVGLSLNLRQNAPTIAILDTGIANEPMLRPILCDEGIDLTTVDDGHPYKVDSDHGTTVACLASFGDAFFKSNTHCLVADAKVFSIKIQEGEEGCINLNGIKKAIHDAHKNYGIRIFNLSMSAGCKNYNSDISIYAYILDKLAFDLDILIFISAGNLSSEDIKEIEAKRLDKNTPKELRTFLQYPNHFYDPTIKLEDAEVHVCECINISEPAESMNNITVGALADNMLTQPRHYGLSLGKEFPAFYTRKYHVDYNSKINNTAFKKNQINRHLFKPDIVMPGGDVLCKDANMQVLGIKDTQLNYVFGAGTSYAAPLAANLAAKILAEYPGIRTQTLKAIIINSSQEVPTSYLEPCIEKLKAKTNPSYPQITSVEKSRLSTMFNIDYLSHTISGHGLPSIEKCLYSDDKRITFIIEEEINFDSHKVINLNIPHYLQSHPNKQKSLILTGTLCYSFNPELGNSMSYLPLHISFNIGNSMNYDNPQANALEYSNQRVKDDNERMAIKNKFTSWSDDFYPANTKRFSNVQKKQFILTGNNLAKVADQIAIIFRCTGRDDQYHSSLKKNTHKFSFVLTLEEIPSITLESHSLYDEISLCNTVENIVELNTELDLSIK